MIALVIMSVIAVVEAIALVLGKKKLDAERAKFSEWLAALPGKAEVAIRREAEVLIADIKQKV